MIKELEAALHALVNARVRLIILYNDFADSYDCLSASTDAVAAIGAYPSVNVCIENSAAPDL
ncbi:hypothetical protein BK022_12325 [Methylorubrum extorquens]|uniref:Uncharacterized protein n=1 Tax=Methylorubrum extorquens TaxID=408 RepID=A0A1S1P0C5_METEX|nr:hypothetical protein BK022_12325 [Methylorubrum extorquens]